MSAQQYSDEEVRCVTYFVSPGAFLFRKTAKFDLKYFLFSYFIKCGILVGEIRRFIICHVLSAVSAGAGNLEAFIVCMAEAG